MRPPYRLLGSLVSSVAWAFAGCGGDPATDGPGASTGLTCLVESTVPLQLDERSSLGFAPSDVLTVATHTPKVPLVWQAPYTGSGELDFDFAPTGGARLVHSKPAPCRDKVEVDVTVNLATADGAIDETFAGSLVAETIDLARLDSDLAAEAIQRIAAKQPGTRVPERLQVTAVFTPYGAGGSFYPSWSKPQGQPPYGISDEDMMAIWPFISKCHTGVPILDRDVHPSVDDLVQPLRGEGRVVRADGSVISAVFDPRVVAGGSCYHANSVIESNDALEALVELDLSPKPDAMVTLTFRITTDLSGGKLGYGEIRWPTSPCSEAGKLGVADFIEHCGDWGVDLTGYEGAHMEIIGNWSSTAGGGADVVITGRRGETFTTAGTVHFGRAFGAR